MSENSGASGTDATSALKQLQEYRLKKQREAQGTHARRDAPEAEPAAVPQNVEDEKVPAPVSVRTGGEDEDVAWKQKQEELKQKLLEGKVEYVLPQRRDVDLPRSKYTTSRREARTRRSWSHRTTTSRPAR